MADLPVQWDDRGPRYLDATRNPVAGGLCLFGVPFDATTSYRPGARFGPDSLRDASVDLETYSPRLDADLNDHPFADVGNLVVPFGAPAPVVRLVREATAGFLAREVIPLLLGGEHTVSVGAIEAVAARYRGLVVVQFDAHADLRPEYLGERYNHACAMRRCLETVGPDGLLQVGIRSGTREEWAELRESRRLLAPEPELLAERLAGLRGRPIYLTVDLDVFDPSCVPGTGTPEPGGIDWHRFEALLDTVPSIELVAADVVELAPQCDPSGNSSVWAAKVVREVGIKLQQGWRQRQLPGG